MILARSARLEQQLLSLSMQRSLPLSQLFNSSIGDEPHGGHGDIKGNGDPGRDESQRNGENIQRQRQMAFAILAYGRGEHRVGAVAGDNFALQPEIADRRHRQHDAVGRRRQSGEIALVHPADHERHERQPEQKEQIGPEGAAVHAFDRLHQMMMVVPVKTDIDVAEDIGEEYRQARRERREIMARRNLQFQHHDGDDDGDDAIGKGFHPALGHAGPRHLRFRHSAASLASVLPSLLCPIKPYSVELEDQLA
ncbi:protein of unknown function [Methylocella tundrae]|uniref:Uncharacterized protein n=1 Tax=Methylocella tundrae TaxID=227605 RepID=A0A4V6YUJ4_METTU|nr:protein of unknown function [Methylocella tundrae]